MSSETPTSAAEFTCELCSRTFPKAWSDAEADAESLAVWGDLPGDERAVLCEECYDVFMEWARERGLVA